MWQEWRNWKIYQFAAQTEVNDSDKAYQGELEPLGIRVE